MCTPAIPTSTEASAPSTRHRSVNRTWNSCQRHERRTAWKDRRGGARRIRWAPACTSSATRSKRTCSWWEPETKPNPGADPDREDQHERQYARVGIEQPVGAEDGGDRTARAERRDARRRGRAGEQRDRRLHQGRHEATCDVEREVAEMPERVLDVLAEDRQEQHVAENVVPAAVHEHGREPAELPRQRSVARGVHAARVERRVVDGRAQVWHLVEDPHQEVRDDQRDVDVREPPRGNAVG